MTRPLRERGTALLSVLLIVAVMAAIAATALDRLGLSTRLAGNAAIATQGRQWLAMAEELAQARLADAAQLSGGQQAALLGVDRTITLPDGQAVTARIDDATNCFNVNSLVVRRQSGVLQSQARRVFQLRDLMILIGFPEAQAQAIADAAADAIDEDRNPRPSGAERMADGSPTPDRLLTTPDDLAGIAGMDADSWQRLRPWLCALPESEVSRINVETLAPDRAALLAMLSPETISLADATAQIEARPASGFGSVVDFWSSGPLRGKSIIGGQSQVAVETRFFRLVTRVGEGDSELSQEALFSVVDGRARLHARRWTHAS